MFDSLPRLLIYIPFRRPHGKSNSNWYPSTCRKSKKKARNCSEIRLVYLKWWIYTPNDVPFSRLGRSPLAVLWKRWWEWNGMGWWPVEVEGGTDHFYKSPMPTLYTRMYAIAIIRHVGTPSIFGPSWTVVKQTLKTFIGLTFSTEHSRLS